MKTQDYDPANPNQTGCIYGMPNETYHAHPAISHSKLTDFIKRPAEYYGRYITGDIERGNSEALTIGSAVHCLLLEGVAEFGAQFAEAPDLGPWRSGADKLNNATILNGLKHDPVPQSELERLASMKKEEIEGFFAERPGPEVLSNASLELVRKCVDSARSHPIASQLLERGVPEVVFRSEETQHGYQVQCRADWLNIDGCELTDGEPYGVDVKTIDSLMNWNREFVKRGYYRAYPFYTKTMELTIGKSVVKHWFWIVIEKQFPWACMIFAPSPEVFQVGLDELGYAMPALGNAIHHNDFSDEGCKRVNMQSLPDYMLIENRNTKPGIRTQEMPDYPSVS